MPDGYTPTVDPGSDFGIQAQQAALDAYNAAINRQNEAALAWSDIQNKVRPQVGDEDQTDPAPAGKKRRLTQEMAASQGKQFDLDYQAAQKRIDSARADVATSSKDYANLMSRLTIAYQAKLNAAKDPDEKALWQAQALKAADEGALFRAKQHLAEAKDQAGIDKAKAEGDAALQNAQTHAGRMPSQNARDDAQTATLNAKLPYIGELTQSQIDLHRQQIATQQSHAGLYVANAARAQAQTGLATAQTQRVDFDTAVLDPARAKQFLAQAGWKDEQINALQLTTPIKLRDLAAKANLDDARAQQIFASINRFQLAPAQDRTLPTLTEFQPSTGQVTGVQNPSYVVPEVQAMQDYNTAIQSVQDQLGNNQITPTDAQSLMANLRTSLDARTKGFTPEQYQQNQLQQAQFGQGILSGMQQQGNTMSNQLLSMASKARGLGGMSFTPYANAQAMGGGAQAMQMALGLIKQIQPVNNRMDALDAISKYAGAKAVIQAAQGQGQSQPPPSPQAGGATTPQQAGGLPDFAAQSVNDPSRGPSQSILPPLAPNEQRNFGQ